MARREEPVSDIDAKLKDLEEGLTPAKPDLTLLGIPEVPETKAEEPERKVKIEPTSGKLILSYTRSIVKRDEDGRIIAIVHDDGKKHITRSLKRNEDGQIVDIVEEIEEEFEE